MDTYIFEVWRRGAPFTPKAAAQQIAVTFKRLPPGSPVALTIGGFERDRREIVDIPEAMEFLRALVAALQVLDVWHDLCDRMHADCVPMLMLAAGQITRDQIRIG